MLYALLTTASLLAAAPVPVPPPAAQAAPPPVQAAAAVAKAAAQPPPCSPEDLALWQSGQEVNHDIREVRTRSERLLDSVLRMKLFLRLEAQAKAAGGEPARALHGRLKAEAGEVQRFLKTRWPVDPRRGCSYPFQAFDNELRVEKGPDHLARLNQTRDRLRGCIAKAQVPIEKLRHEHGELEKLVAEAETLLKGAGPAAPVPPAPAAAGQGR